MSELVAKLVLLVLTFGLTGAWATTLWLCRECPGAIQIFLLVFFVLSGVAVVGLLFSLIQPYYEIEELEPLRPSTPQPSYQHHHREHTDSVSP